jgi:hypothetical protein
VKRVHKGLVSTRKSHSFYVDLVDEPALAARLEKACSANGFYESMLIQDLDHIIRYDFGRDGQGEARVVGTDDDDVVSIIADALPSRYGRSRSVAEQIREFVSRVAQQLVGCGPVTCEIDYLYQPEGPDDGKPTSVRLEIIPAGSFDRLDGRPIQYVPRGAATRFTKDGLGFVELDEARLVEFRLDKATEHRVSRVMSFLTVASQQQHREFGLLQTATGDEGGYDVTVHHTAIGELVAKATEPIGWDARGLYGDAWLEPYRVWRRLRFLEFRVEIRDTVLRQLNATLVGIGAVLGFQAQIELSGLPTLADVSQAKSDLETGDKLLSDFVEFAM